MLFFSWSTLAQRHLVIVEGDQRSHQAFEDTLTLRMALEELAWDLVIEGHIFMSWDTLSTPNDSLMVSLLPGTRYDFEQPPPSKTGRQKMLRPFLNDGYPFASVVMDSIALKEGLVTAGYRVDPGPEIVFDSVSLRREIRLSNSYLYKTLGFRLGEPYSERVFQATSSRLQRLQQVEVVSPPDVGFESGKATIFLDLKDRKSDSFEGILGLLNDQNAGTTVTGYLKLYLNNLFSSGKELHIDWNRFAAQSQDLDLSYVHPYLLGSDLQLSAGLKILRQDSAFTNRDLRLGFDFPLSKDWYLGVGFARHVGDLLGEEPDVRQGFDYTNNGYGAQMRWKDDLARMTQYRSYLGATAAAEVGDKRIRRNASVAPEAYDTLELRSTNYQLDLELAGQWTFAKQSALYGHLQVGTVQGTQILRNEYYRVGGLRSFRGFNENQFFAQTLVKLQSEYRLYYDRQSYLLAIVDLGYIAQEVGSNFLGGYGLGIAIDTQAGNFQLIFALGNSEDTAPDVRNIKAHFGYSVIF